MLLATAALAHQPEDGVYPTTESQWWGCCHTDDCRPAEVEVGAYNENLRIVRSTLGNFIIPQHRIHRVQKVEASEYVCTNEGEPPKPDGDNVICVFNKMGMW